MVIAEVLFEILNNAMDHIEGDVEYKRLYSSVNPANTG